MEHHGQEVQRDFHQPTDILSAMLLSEDIPSTVRGMVEDNMRSLGIKATDDDLNQCTESIVEIYDLWKHGQDAHPNITYGISMMITTLVGNYREKITINPRDLIKLMEGDNEIDPRL